MIHRLARDHYKIIISNKHFIAPINDDKETCYLNLNINSFSNDNYKLYPKQFNYQLATKYIEILNSFTNIQTRFPIGPENILFTLGSSTAVNLIIRAFCDPSKDSILVTKPTFPYYEYAALIENILVENSPLLGQNYNILDFQKILSSKSKVLFLCTPNNPVGSVLSFNEMETVISKYQGIVVVDEAYIEWADIRSTIELIEKYDNLIILRTFSKIWALAGVRCGSVIANKKIIKLLNFIQPLFSHSTATSNIILSRFKKFNGFQKFRNLMIESRSDLFEFLLKLKFVKKIYASHANFLLVKFQQCEKIEKILLNEKILVSNNSKQVANTLRISIGTHNEMNRLKKILKKINL